MDQGGYPEIFDDVLQFVKEGGKHSTRITTASAEKHRDIILKTAKELISVYAEKSLPTVSQNLLSVVQVV